MIGERTDATRPKRAVVVTVALAALMLVQCKPGTEPEPGSGTPQPAAATPAAPVSIPTLNRAELIAAANAAADQYASGARVEGTDPLVGRTFSIRIPFACGPLSEGGAGDRADGLPRAGWGPERRTIQLSLTPGDWTQSALMAEPNAAARWEQVEGFWAPRPWLTGENCPALSADPLQGGPSVAAAQTLGVAAVFEEGASRIGRRNGRAYAYTVRGEGDQPVQRPAQGYRLLLEGRVVGFPTSGRAFRCRASGPDQRPVCVIAVQLDRVAVTQADGAVMSEWHGA